MGDGAKQVVVVVVVRRRMEIRGKRINGDGQGEVASPQPSQAKFSSSQTARLIKNAEQVREPASSCALDQSAREEQ